MSMRRVTGRDRRAPGNAVAAAFNIASYYGANAITMHLDADQGITLNGSTVSQWTDLVSSVALVQGTAGSQPTYTTSAANGHNVVVLDSSSKNLRNSTMAAFVNAECTIFMVVKTTGTGWGFGRMNAAGNLGYFYNPTATNTNINFLAGGNVQGGAYSTTAYQVVSMRFQASGGFGTTCTTQEIYVNGSLQSVTGSPTYSQVGTSSLASVGWTATTGAHSFAAILLAENKMMTTTDHAAIVNWLRTKYGTG